MEKNEFSTSILIGLVDILKSSASLLLTDLDGTITYVNDNFCELSGYNREEILGKNPRLFNSGFHGAEFFSDLWITVNSGQIWQGQICNKKKDGTHVWLDTTIGPIFNEQHVLEKFIVLRFDVTEQQKIESLAREQSAQLTANSKMVVLGEMASGVAHEINNPLAIISGKTSILIRAVQENNVDLDKISIELNKIKQATHKITKIVNGLRRFSRNADNDPLVPVVIQEFIEDGINLCREKLKELSVELRYIPNTDIEIQVNGRASELSQVIINLLQNACDAVESLPERWIELSVDHNDLNVQIRITDSGYGIDADVVDRIMQPFFTTKEVGKGTGLGLSISSQIISSHFGKLYYEKDCARTQFVLEIPIKK
jgi:PAS domain S-box-containing protein